jgi:hypothetical protein
LGLNEKNDIFQKHKSTFEAAMTYIPISVDKYIKKHIELNPNENERTLRARLEESLEAYKNGVKCSCGNNIWVVGSATAGHSCFTCITGENSPTGDFEIDSVLEIGGKQKN